MSMEYPDFGQRTSSSTDSPTLWRRVSLTRCWFAHGAGSLTELTLCTRTPHDMSLSQTMSAGHADAPALQELAKGRRHVVLLNSAACASISTCEQSSPVLPQSIMRLLSWTHTLQEHCCRAYRYDIYH
jgi:hypothetical protein